MKKALIAFLFISAWVVAEIAPVLSLDAQQGEVTKVEFSPQPDGFHFDFQASPDYNVLVIWGLDHNPCFSDETSSDPSFPLITQASICDLAAPKLKASAVTQSGFWVGFAPWSGPSQANSFGSSISHTMTFLQPAPGQLLLTFPKEDSSSPDYNSQGDPSQSNYDPIADPYYQLMGALFRNDVTFQVILWKGDSLGKAYQDWVAHPDQKAVLFLDPVVLGDIETSEAKKLENFVITQIQLSPSIPDQGAGENIAPYLKRWDQDLNDYRRLILGQSGFIGGVVDNSFSTTRSLKIEYFTHMQVFSNIQAEPQKEKDDQGKDTGKTLIPLEDLVVMAQEQARNPYGFLKIPGMEDVIEKAVQEESVREAFQSLGILTIPLTLVNPVLGIALATALQVDQIVVDGPNFLNVTLLAATLLVRPVAILTVGAAKIGIQTTAVTLRQWLGILKESSSVVGITPQAALAVVWARTLQAASEDLLLGLVRFGKQMSSLSLDSSEAAQTIENEIPYVSERKQLIQISNAGKYLHTRLLMRLVPWLYRLVKQWRETLQPYLGVLSGKVVTIDVNGFFYLLKQLGNDAGRDITHDPNFLDPGSLLSFANLLKEMGIKVRIYAPRTAKEFSDLLNGPLPQLRDFLPDNVVQRYAGVAIPEGDISTLSEIVMDQDRLFNESDWVVDFQWRLKRWAEAQNPEADKKILVGIPPLPGTDTSTFLVQQMVNKLKNSDISPLSINAWNVYTRQKNAVASPYFRDLFWDQDAKRFYAYLVLTSNQAGMPFTGQDKVCHVKLIYWGPERHRSLYGR